MRRLKNRIFNLFPNLIFRSTLDLKKHTVNYTRFIMIFIQHFNGYRCFMTHILGLKISIKLQKLCILTPYTLAASRGEPLVRESIVRTRESVMDIFYLMYLGCSIDPTRFDSYIYDRQKIWKEKNIKQKTKRFNINKDLSNYRYIVDYYEDFKLIYSLIDKYGNLF